MKTARINKLIALTMVVAFPTVLWAQVETQVADNNKSVEAAAPAGDTAKVTGQGQMMLEMMRNAMAARKKGG